MKAIEIKSSTDEFGHLKIDYQLDRTEQKVRVLILFEDEKSNNDEEKLWMNSISSNPAFDFLNDPEEDIYSLNDGEPLSD